MKKIVVFAGGRGTDSLIQGLMHHEDIELTMLINAYDDGLSTGLVRRIIGDMLGPSDLRKNIARFASLSNNKSNRALAKILEYRFDLECNYDDGLAICNDFINLTFNSHTKHSKILNPLREKLTFRQTLWLSNVTRSFFDYIDNKNSKNEELTFNDMSLGNIIFSGAYLLNERDFNKATKNLSEIAGVHANILNITQGEALTLVAIKEDGEFLFDEASIVSKQTESKIKELYLIPDSELKDIVYKISKTNVNSKKEEILSKASKIPNLNKDAAKSIEQADLIIYGSGTQHSSLYPSYMTEGVFSKIMKNKLARKIYIGNVQRDHDSENETQTTLFKKFLRYLIPNQDFKKIQNVVDTVILHKPNPELRDKFYDFDISDIKSKFKFDINVVQKQLELKDGKHSFTRTTRELLNSVNVDEVSINYSTKLISIIIPSFNEDRYIQKTIDDVIDFTEKKSDFRYEIICADGGSTDNTNKILNRYDGKIKITHSKHFGKGSALKAGLKISHGDIVVFFPSDNEFDVNDITKVINPLVNQEFSMVVGSRAYDSIDLNNRLKRIYNKRSLTFFLSKYGGMLLTIIYLLRYRRLLGDPLSSFKALNVRALDDIKGYSNGFDYEIEILAKLYNKKAIVLEVPVTYTARSKEDGKKMNFKEGLKCLLRLVIVSIRSN